MHSLKASLDSDWDIEPMECGVTVEGKRHDDSFRCANTTSDEITSGFYCKVKESARIRQRLNTLKWLPTFLNFYGRNGINREDFEFLEVAGLVWSYRYLR